jgi:hypothetical protein
MKLKQIIGGVLILAGIILFYAAFTETATEWLTDWVTRHVPHMKGQYSAKQLLLAWGGMFAGFGGMIGFRKV